MMSKRRKRTPKNYTEADLCREASVIYKAQGFVVYPEMEGVDLVLHRDNKLWAVEAKLNPTLHQIEQLWTRMQNKDYDYYVALIPGNRFHRTPQFYKHLTNTYGIGIHRLSYYGGAQRIETPTVARIYNRTGTRIESIMMPEAQTHTEAGKPSCKRWGKWRALKQRYINYIADNGPTDIEVLIRALEPEAVGKRGGILKHKLEYRRYSLTNEGRTKGEWSDALSITGYGLVSLR